MYLSELWFTECSNSERENQISYINIYVESRKIVSVILFVKEEYRHRCREQLYGYQAGRRGGMNWEIGIDVYTLY